MHWETKKNLCDLLYCDICFIVLVWNQNCNISEVCLYIHKMDYYFPEQIPDLCYNMDKS